MNFFRRITAFPGIPRDFGRIGAPCGTGPTP
jgi:hypothetical protein